MEPTTALIAAIIGGVAAGLVNIIKALFSRNQNSKDRMDYELKVIELVGSQNNATERVAASIDRLNDKVDCIYKELGGLNERVIVLEKKMNESNS